MSELSPEAQNLVDQYDVGQLAERVVALEAQVARLREHIDKLDTALEKAFLDYAYEDESGIKKMTLQSYAVIQRIRKDKALEST